MPLRRILLSGEDRFPASCSAPVFLGDRPGSVFRPLHHLSRSHQVGHDFGENGTSQMQIQVPSGGDTWIGASNGSAFLVAGKSSFARRSASAANFSIILGPNSLLLPDSRFNTSITNPRYLVTLYALHNLRSLFQSRAFL